MKRRLIKIFASLVLVVLAVLTVMTNVSPVNAAVGDSFKLVTDVKALASGDQIVIVYNNSINNLIAMSAQNNSNYRGTTSITVSDKSFTWNENICVLTLGGTTVGWTLEASDGYLYYSGSKNTLNTSKDKSAYTWDISISDDGTATIKSVQHSERYLQYNKNSPRFACYTNTQQNVSIYKLVQQNVDCKHSNTENVAEVPATCTTSGTTAGVKCSDCGAIISGL